MPAFPNAPLSYKKPYIGQPFKRIQDEGRIEYAVVNGVRDLGSPDRWIAHLTSGFQDFREMVGSERKYANTADWHPVPDEDIYLVRRLLEVEGVLADVLRRVAVLETPTSVEAAPTPPVIGERPRRGATA